MSACLRAPRAAIALRAYYKDVVTHYHGPKPRDAELHAATRDEPGDDLVPLGGLLFVAHHDDDDVLGCAGLRLLGGGNRDVTRVHVAPSTRGRGPWSRLPSREETTRRHGVNVLRLDTRSDLVEARRLHARHGYEEVEPFSHRPYTEHWSRKPLAS